MQQPQLDLMHAVLVLLGYFFGHQAAQVLGPYVVIFLASTVGASFALYRAETMTRAASLFFFARLVGLAVLVSGAMAMLLERWLGPDTASYSVIFVALIIGFIGPDWPALGGRALEWGRRWLEKKGDAQ